MTVTLTPEQFQQLALAWIAVATILVPGLAGLVLLVLREVSVIKAKIQDLQHEHDATAKILDNHIITSGQ